MSTVRACACSCAGTRRVCVPRSRATLARGALSCARKGGTRKPWRAPRAGLDGARRGWAWWASVGLGGARCRAWWGTGAIPRGAGPRQASRSSRRRASSRRSSRSATSRTRTASCRPSRPRVRRPQPWLAARGRDPVASRSVMWSLPLSRLCHAPAVPGTAEAPVQGTTTLPNA